MLPSPPLVIQDVALRPLRLKQGTTTLDVESTPQDVSLAPASQIADDDTWQEEYERMREAPEAPPIDALRCVLPVTHSTFLDPDSTDVGSLRPNPFRAIGSATRFER